MKQMIWPHRLFGVISLGFPFILCSLIGCATYSTCGGAEVIRGGTLETTIITNFGLHSYDDSATALTSYLPLMLRVGYGLWNLGDVSIRAGLSYLGGDLRACLLRSNTKRKLPYWVFTGDLGMGLSWDTRFESMSEVNYHNRFVYPGFTVGYVWKKYELYYELYGRGRYYYSLFYTHDPIDDARFGGTLGFSVIGTKSKGDYGALTAETSFTCKREKNPSGRDYLKLVGADLSFGMRISFGILRKVLRERWNER